VTRITSTDVHVQANLEMKQALSLGEAAKVPASPVDGAILVSRRAREPRIMHLRPMVLFGGVFLLLLGVLSSFSNAQSPCSIVDRFRDSSFQPLSPLVVNWDRALYRMVDDDQSFWYGTVSGSREPGTNCGLKQSIFSVDPDLQTSYRILHQFHNRPDGAYPQGPRLQADDGNINGSTALGSSASYCPESQDSVCGTIFRPTPYGIFTTLDSFRGTGSDGIVPGDLIEDGQKWHSSLYRVTEGYYPDPIGFLQASDIVNPYGRTSVTVFHLTRDDSLIIHCNDPTLTGCRIWPVGQVTAVRGADYERAPRLDNPEGRLPSIHCHSREAWQGQCTGCFGPAIEFQLETALPCSIQRPSTLLLMRDDLDFTPRTMSRECR
jgi:hypothetical protein